MIVNCSAVLCSSLPIESGHWCWVVGTRCLSLDDGNVELLSLSPENHRQNTTSVVCQFLLCRRRNEDLHVAIIAIRQDPSVTNQILVTKELSRNSKWAVDRVELERSFSNGDRIWTVRATGDRHSLIFAFTPGKWWPGHWISEYISVIFCISGSRHIVNESSDENWTRFFDTFLITRSNGSGRLPWIT
jgi:hypothetical protein